MKAESPSQPRPICATKTHICNKDPYLSTGRCVGKYANLIYILTKTKWAAWKNRDISARPLREGMENGRRVEGERRGEENEREEEGGREDEGVGVTDKNGIDKTQNTGMWRLSIW